MTSTAVLRIKLPILIQVWIFIPDPTTTNKNTPKSKGPTGNSSSVFYKDMANGYFKDSTINDFLTFPLLLILSWYF